MSSDARADSARRRRDAISSHRLSLGLPEAEGYNATDVVIEAARHLAGQATSDRSHLIGRSINPATRRRLARTLDRVQSTSEAMDLQIPDGDPDREALVSAVAAQSDAVEIIGRVLLATVEKSH